MLFWFILTCFYVFLLSQHFSFCDLFWLVICWHALSITLIKITVWSQNWVYLIIIVREYFWYFSLLSFFLFLFFCFLSLLFFNCEIPSHCAYNKWSRCICFLTLKIVIFFFTKNRKLAPSDKWTTKGSVPLTLIFASFQRTVSFE